MEAFEISEDFNVSPEVLYEAWLNGEIHGEMTGSEAYINPEVGGEFTAWDGYISGKNIETVPNKKIVQEWRTTDFSEEAENSILEILFEKNKTGTCLILKHSNIPDGHGDDYKDGWIDYYFKPMKDYFKNK